ncbi:MAG: PPC domain-containing protein, partial [Candidatus Methylumidiphilus sp.]
MKTLFCKAFITSWSRNRFCSIYAFLFINLMLIASQEAMALTKPIQQSPANNAVITSGSVTFSWTHPYTDKYEVKIKTGGGTLKYASGKISSKSITVNLANVPLTYGSTYKWYVVVYANGQEDSSADSWFTYKPTGRVDLNSGVDISPGSVMVGQNFTASFKLKEFMGGAKTFEYVELWIQNSSGNDLYAAQRWNNVSFSPNEVKSYTATTYLNSGRTAGTYRAIVKGKIAGDTPFNFGVVSGSGASNPRTFTALVDDHVNSCTGATAVAVNTSKTGNIESAGDYDYFKIQVPSAGTLKVYSTGSTDTYGYLKNASCADISGGSNDNQSSTNKNFLISKSVTTGTYYVAVRHYSATDSGGYVFNVSFTASTPSNDRFTWPVDPLNPTNGHANSGGLNQCKNNLLCFWISNITENTTNDWYDAWLTDKTPRRLL